MHLIRFNFPDLENVGVYLGTRLGGESQGAFARANISLEVGDSRERVLANREACRRFLGFDRLVELRQVHGDDIHFDLQGDFLPGPQVTGDGAAVSEPGSAVMIKTADCQPLFLAHAGGRHVCGLHVGWRGNRINLPGSGVSRFCRHYGLRPGDVLAFRGPSLGPCCAEFRDFSRHWTEQFKAYYEHAGRKMDLWRLTRDQLIQAGLRPENIFSADLCTRCNAWFFFSYRREKVCGRQGNFILISGPKQPGQSHVPGPF